MKIDIQTIPHNLQRYNTAGDWVFEPDEDNYIGRIVDGKPMLEEKLTINVSETGNEDFNFLIALHEMVEAHLCKIARITAEQVDNWDKEHEDSDEPGTLPGCPYAKQHDIATFVEMYLANILGINWEKYNDTIMAL